MVDPNGGAPCTAVLTAGATQDPLGSGQGQCQALSPVTDQVAGENSVPVSISQCPGPSQIRGIETADSESPIQVVQLPPGQDSPIQKTGEKVGKLIGKVGKEGNVGKEGEKSDESKVVQLPPGQDSPIQKTGEKVGKLIGKVGKEGNVGKEGEKSDESKVSHARGVGSPKEGKPGTIKVCQLRSASQFSINLQVGDRCVSAVVDSAAEVSIISDKVYRSLKKTPNKLRDVTLHTAGRQMVMQGFIVGPVQMKIGSRWYQEILYVAPIEQDMLLGFDILRGKSILDMVKGTLTFDGQELSLDVGSSSGQAHVARVTVAKRHVIPPNCAVQLPCRLSQEMSDYVMEPVEKLRVLAPRVVRSAGEEPIMCLVNVSDRYQLIKKGAKIARAYPVEEFLEESPDECHQEEMSVPQDGSQDGRQKSFEVGPQVAAVSLDGTESSNVKTALPEHLRMVYDNSVEHLSPEECSQLADLLRNYQDVFAKNEFDLGTFSEIEHTIDVQGAKPVKQRMRRTPACFAGEEEAHLDKMLKAGVIQESTSEWASAPVLIRKRDGTVRWCIDYRALNEVTVKDNFPLPLVDDCLDTLSGSVWFSKLDANSAYWQVKIKGEDRKKTAFITKYGLFEHVRMGFGLCNGPATCARVVNLVLRSLNWKTVLAFLDDILVLGKSFQDHLSNLEEALARFRQYGLKLKPKKCVFFCKQVEFLGRIVSQDSLSMSDVDIKTVKDWPTPLCSKDVERFAGLANYHRTFVKDFSRLAEPLYQVVGKNKFKWGEEQQWSFDALKHALTNPPVLSLPNREDEMILDTDASDHAIGAELIQVQNGEEKVIAYGSLALTAEQRKYCVTRKELLAVLRFTRQFRHHLLGKPFVVRTDHASLIWLTRFREHSMMMSMLK